MYFVFLVNFITFEQRGNHCLKKSSKDYGSCYKPSDIESSVCSHKNVVGR